MMKLVPDNCNEAASFDLASSLATFLWNIFESMLTFFVEQAESLSQAKLAVAEQNTSDRARIRDDFMMEPQMMRCRCVTD